MRLLREPLCHFVLLGAGLLLLDRALAPPRRDRIVVDQEAREGLRADHQRRVGALPSAAEEQALVDRHIDGEILYREALALGLDRGDVIVRRRLIQKMEFLLEAGTAAVEPGAAELEAYLGAHRERYALPERLSLDHVFVAGAGAEERATRLLAELRAGAAPEALGDPFPRGHTLTLRSQEELAAVFGPTLAGTIMALPEGSWQGPLGSPFGLHLLRVSARAAQRSATLAEVRARVREDLLAERRAAERRAGIARIRERYEVVR